MFLSYEYLLLAGCAAEAVVAVQDLNVVAPVVKEGVSVTGVGEPEAVVAVLSMAVPSFAIPDFAAATGEDRAEVVA